MTATFQTALVNHPLDDPGLFIRLAHQKRALLFDLGNLSALTPKALLKVSHVFVTHTHIDHFYGFDRLLRVIVERPKTLHLFGPRGFIDNVEGKLAGYCWNLLGPESHSVKLRLSEVTPETVITRSYRCRNGWRPVSDDTEMESFSQALIGVAGFSVEVEIVDHGTPCLAFALKEPFRINILKPSMARLGLSPGPWLQGFKSALYNGLPADTEFEIPAAFAERRQRFSLKGLAQRITRTTAGQKIAYITDVAYTDDNIEKIRRLAGGADHLFIEAAFLNRHAALAKARRHLTARQAGKLAAVAGAKRLTPFHFSARYSDCPEALVQEAQQAFERHRRLG